LDFFPGGTDIAFSPGKGEIRILGETREIMSYPHHILISHPEPERRSPPWYLPFGALLLACLLFSSPGYQGVSDDYQEDPYVTTWLSKEKAGELMRYHGASGIMITEDRVYIKRDSRWICVYRDPSALPEKETLQGPPATAGRVPGGKS
jgi:hypothetical protein